MMFSQIDQVTLGDHYYLTEDDACLYALEYHPGKGYEHGNTNSFITNIKKPIDRKGRQEWFYKEQALNKAARMLRDGIPTKWLEAVTMIPIPPSKTKSDPLYDDRLLQILSKINSAADYDIRELIVQTCSRETMHLTEHRYTPDQLAAMYEFDEDLLEPTPKKIMLFDDVLTSGTHFRAIKDLLATRFPGVEVVGVFLARVYREPFDPAFIFSSTD